MITCYDVVKTIVRSEKGTTLEKERKYLFRVATEATKIDVKRAVEEIYKVKVDAVNTVMCKASSSVCAPVPVIQRVGKKPLSLLKRDRR